MAPVASRLAARVPWTLSWPAVMWGSLPQLPRGRRGLRLRVGRAEVAAAGLLATASSSVRPPLVARRPRAGLAVVHSASGCSVAAVVRLPGGARRT